MLIFVDVEIYGEVPWLGMSLVGQQAGGGHLLFRKSTETGRGGSICTNFVEGHW